MGIFNRTYTAQEVHDKLEEAQVQLFDTVQRGMQGIGTKEALEEYMKRLKSCGFTSSKNLEVLKEKKRLIDTIELLNHVHKVFGTSAMVISFSDFEYILKKYKLVCGELSDYTGVIPEVKLAEVDSAKQKLLEISKNYRTNEVNNLLHNSILKLNKVVAVNTQLSSNIVEELKLFPFVRNDSDYMPQYHTMNGINVSASIKTKQNAASIFIAAPANEMSNTISTFKRVVTKDPFVFSYTELGIIIYSKWGTESEDEVLKKYDFLNLV